MKRLSCAFPLALLTVSACSPAVPAVKPSAQTIQTETMVANLYKEVIARRPFLYDLKVFAPYLSKELLHRFDESDACFDDWERQNPGTTDKPPFGIEFRPFSGGTDGEAQTFQIERTEPRKDGSSLVYVQLTYEEPTFKQVWRVAVVVVRENGRPVVDEIVILKGKDQPYEGRLSEALTQPECKGSRYVGGPG